MKTEDLNAAVNLLCEFAGNHLPPDWDIELHMSADEACIELYHDGELVSGDFDSEQSEFLALVNHARETEGMDSA